MTVEAIRIENARIALEESEEPIARIAAQCGFGTIETMRRAFQRRIQVGPSDYRKRFRPSASSLPAAA